MPSTNGHMNQLIRAGRGEPVDLTDPAAINRAIREAAGVPTPAPPLGPPPPPDTDPADFNRPRQPRRPAPAGRAGPLDQLLAPRPPQGAGRSAGRAVNAAEAQDHLATLEAEATLLRSRIRTLADAGELVEVTRLYRRIGELRLELLAARHVVDRVVRRTTRQYGQNTALDTGEHLLSVELAALGVEPDQAVRRLLG